MLAILSISQSNKQKSQCQVHTEAGSFLIPLPLSDILLTRSHAAARPRSRTGSRSDLAGAPCCHSSPRAWTAGAELRVAWAPPLRAPHLYGTVVRMAEWGHAVHPPPRAFKGPIKTGLCCRPPPCAQFSFSPDRTECLCLVV